MYASSMPSIGAIRMNTSVGIQASGLRASKLCDRPREMADLRHACSGVSTQQRVGRTGGQSEIPGNQVPCDRADEPGQDHIRRNDVHVDAFDDRFRHMRSERECRDEVTERRPDYGLSGGENARCNDGGYGIRRVMKAVDVIKCERNRDDDYDEEESRIHAG